MATHSETRIYWAWWRERDGDMIQISVHENAANIRVAAARLLDICESNRETGHYWTGALKGPTSGTWYYYNEDECDEFLHYAKEWGII